MGRSTRGQRQTMGMRSAPGGRSYGTPPVSVRLPVVEETLRQVSIVSAALSGRPLSSSERALARPVFEQSIDYDRVRIVETSILAYRTVGNVIRVESGFTTTDEEMAKTLIHELTHVWQYQQSGTGYMSTAIQTQIGAAIGSGSRNAAYDYVASAERSFFQFTPEQQGSIVENYFAMVRDQAAPATHNTFLSNHTNAQGAFVSLDRARRMAEIRNELPIHERYMQQLRRTRPRPERQIMTEPTEFMTIPGLDGSHLPSTQQVMRPILRIDF